MKWLQFTTADKLKQTVWINAQAITSIYEETEKTTGITINSGFLYIVIENFKSVMSRIQEILTI